MSNKKKLYYAFLVALLICAICININSSFTYSSANKDVAAMYIKIGDRLRDVQMYGLSNFYYKVAMKVSHKTIWLDYNIAKNIIYDNWNKPYRKNTKQLNEAVERLNKELKNYPGNADIYAALGDAYYLLQDYKNSIKYYELALNKVKELNKIPDWGWGLSQLAYIYSHVIGDNNTALMYMERLIKLEPNDANNYFLYGWILSHLERYNEAVKAYDKYLQSYPDNVAALVNISGCEIKIHDYQNAEKHVEHGLKLNSTSSYLLSNKVDVLQHQHKFKEADDILNKINRYYYNGYLAYWEWGEIEKYKGNNKKADEYFNKAKENAKEYISKYCDKPYDLSDKSGNCSNRYKFLEDFETNLAKTPDF